MVLPRYGRGDRRHPLAGLHPAASKRQARVSRDPLPRWRMNNDRRYFGRFNPSRPAWTPIIRHRKVNGAASPDDPALTGYWADRRRRNQPPLDRSTLRLLKAQHGRCDLCADLLLHADRPPHTPEEWHQWHRTTRKAITRQHIIANGQDGRPDHTRLVHTHCLRRTTSAGGNQPASSRT